MNNLTGLVIARPNGYEKSLQIFDPIYIYNTRIYTTYISEDYMYYIYI